jgi:hypothetical protein
MPPADGARASAAADVATAHWMTRERIVAYSWICVAVYAVVAIVWVVMSTNLVDAKGKPLGYDFITFWAASFLALAGDAAASFDMRRILAVQRMAVPAGTKVFLWHYPPTFHLVVLPLALLPYIVAYLVWTAGTFAAYLLVLRRFVQRPETLLVLAAFPGAFINAFHGQNGFLTAALFGAALLHLEARPVLAGMLFGLLSWKPQLGLLVPIALLCGGQWAAFAAAATTTLAFAALSVVVIGSDAWFAFLDNLPLVHSLLEQGQLPWEKIPSVYAGMRLLGASGGLAYGAHIAVAVIAATLVALFWRRGGSLQLRGAVLVSGSLLIPPYLFDYDLTLLAIPIAILAWDGIQHGWRKGDREVLLAAWLAPLLAPVIADYINIPVAKFVTVALLAISVRRCLATAETGRALAPPPPLRSA